MQDTEPNNLKGIIPPIPTTAWVSLTAHPAAHPKHGGMVNFLVDKFVILASPGLL